MIGPTILFFDEIDTIAGVRDGYEPNKLLSILLTEIDGFGINESNFQTNPIYIIATTNIRESIDPALRRTGRLDLEIEIPVPNSESRFEILKSILNNINHDMNDNDLRDISYNLNGYVGSDINTLVRQAYLDANMK